jgi:murein DD-endopeptidase MepM/ murein hydrolase activator NlpD
VLLAHLQQRSIAVHAGDRVRCGDVVGNCGNSGNTTAPHLHMQVQDKADIFAPGVHTFPIAFRNVTRPGVYRRGEAIVATDAVCR